MSDRQRNGFILVLVVGLLAASAFVIATKPTILGLDLKGGVELVYQGQPTPQTPTVTQDALSRAVNIMRERVDQLGVSEPQIQTSGGNQITAALPDVTDIHRAEALVGTTAQLAFYDWEANVLTPSGQPVAKQLEVQDQTAQEISRGVGSLAPGDPGAGSMNLYEAVSLAHKQTAAPFSASLSHAGPLYYMFGAPGSAACETAAHDQNTTPVAGQHCLLSGPEDNMQDLVTGLPSGVSASEGQVLTVPQGWVVLQAANLSASNQVKPNSPDAQFYVLKDNVALRGQDITNPQQSTDTTGAPDVTFGFTGSGGKAFQNVTAQIAQRGQTVSTLGQSLNQHFAVALDNQLITVPQIDFKQYPQGIDGSQGANITGGFTEQSASDLATQLRDGALPIKLTLISEQQVSATLGKQALKQGLIAGAVGLLVVVIFLIAYYRMLGVIATAGLFVYGVYFYALIKLIPITLTLAGIAGLILTIGVAADANIVIFERVKEEIRRGAGVRQGIVTGYRKGLTAIIDANVVTIMTAFILFVLATADVQGFAFTLGIGTFVSLFTAVMATQAILMTMGRSRLLSRPSLLGAGGPKREWRFDFMGMSRYFFTMSGVILLVGALAVGARGLNLGIDFTSGSRITVGLVHPATDAQISSVMSSVGAGDATVQKVTNNKTLGSNGFQISSKELKPSGRDAVFSQLESKFGILNNGNDFNFTSVGPTFGSTVAKSAVIAIIASLLVISAYVALRFEWKFTIPVLIALMHDLLITSGVYALTGREVTTDTVAALLTILGYSIYDTIIVFDRVRENIPRMPRAAFSQIVNRSMSEVLTRSLATTGCTLLPVVALLLFSGTGTLQDFAFALLVGILSGAYSSIFIASPVLTHWKEREPNYRARRRRIESEFGYVPAYAGVGADMEPDRKRIRRPGRLTEPEPEAVSAAEFEQMKRDLDIERGLPARHTSTLTQRLAHTSETEPASPRRAKGSGDGAPKRAGSGNPKRAGRGAAKRAGDRPPQRAGDGAPQRAADVAPQRAADVTPQQGADLTPQRAADVTPPQGADVAPQRAPEVAPQRAADAEPQRAGDGDVAPMPAPDIAENEGMAPVQKPKTPPKSRSRNRRHGRRR